jgi:D-tyrosyl-tRNA(Tyr) deacylase
MKVVLQRVREAAVEVRGVIRGRVGQGICLLVGIEKGDSEEDAGDVANKIVDLRIFSDEDGKMNLSLADIGGEVLAVSQFTLAGSVKKGRRPSFDNVEEPRRAEALFLGFAQKIRDRGINVETGVFGEVMNVHLVNDGPVTFYIQNKNSST